MEGIAKNYEGSSLDKIIDEQVKSIGVLRVKIDRLNDVILYMESGGHPGPMETNKEKKDSVTRPQIGFRERLCENVNEIDHLSSMSSELIERIVVLSGF